ncbi:MAG: M23 family metallopeptidase [Patescibacteria group bacterium]
MLGVILVPSLARAFSIGEFFRTLFGSSVETVDASSLAAHQDPIISKPFLEAVRNTNPKAATGGPTLAYTEENAIIPAIGPLGTISDAEETRLSIITTYTVRDGDNLSVIARTFGISVGTIYWANNISRPELIKPGDVLVILPVSGVKHTVAKGDTIESIAKKYKGDVEEIRIFNELAIGSTLSVGKDMIIPNVDMVTQAPSAVAKSLGVRGSSAPSAPGYFGRPLTGGKKTQGLHGYNAVDIAAPCGTPLYASAGGTVIISRNSGWNGGYGKYVAIKHPNGTQTVYGHMSTVMVAQGGAVEKGQYIGDVGTTGRSTGCHVHFEIRGAANPF